MEMRNVRRISGVATAADGSALLHCVSDAHQGTVARQVPIECSSAVGMANDDVVVESGGCDFPIRVGLFDFDHDAFAGCSELRADRHVEVVPVFVDAAMAVPRW
jgi:hypothetical protein